MINCNLVQMKLAITSLLKRDSTLTLTEHLGFLYDAIPRLNERCDATPRSKGNEPWTSFE
jgi:hypothetical protein